MLSNFLSDMLFSEKSALYQEILTEAKQGAIVDETSKKVFNNM